MVGAGEGGGGREMPAPGTARSVLPKWHGSGLPGLLDSALGVLPRVQQRQMDDPRNQKSPGALLLRRRRCLRRRLHPRAPRAVGHAPHPARPRAGGGVRGPRRRAAGGAHDFGEVSRADRDGGGGRRDGGAFCGGRFAGGLSGVCGEREGFGGCGACDPKRNERKAIHGDGVRGNFPGREGDGRCARESSAGFDGVRPGGKAGW
mmetsp:Transcript_593/g.1751  ORF Transcript_593/g.1751 Transcript_593/m.1751 type:complete len:204 (+) Transcript_593:493-1104(+)